MTTSYHFQVLAWNVGVISKLKYSLPPTTLKTFYQRLIVSNLSYCSIIWSGSSNANLTRRIISQKRIIRNVASRDHTSPLFSLLSLLKFKDLIKVSIVSWTHKALTHTSPSWLTDFFYTKNTIHSTRNASNIHHHSCDTKFDHFELKNTSHFKFLPLDIQCLQSPLRFKKSMKQRTAIEY